MPRCCVIFGNLWCGICGPPPVGGCNPCSGGEESCCSNLPPENYCGFVESCDNLSLGEYCDMVCQPSSACCGCDWCCNHVSDADCASIRVYPWENLPTSHEEGCNGDLCPVTPPQPVCRREEFVPGKRPSVHEPPERGLVDNNRIGRHELHSLAPIRAIDRAPEVNECRTFYGQVSKHPSTGPRHFGWLCGQRNRRQTGNSAKRSNRCIPSKRPDGRHSFQCAYRVPCPEKPTVCL